MDKYDLHTVLLGFESLHFSISTHDHSWSGIFNWKGNRMDHLLLDQAEKLSPTIFFTQKGFQEFAILFWLELQSASLQNWIFPFLLIAQGPKTQLQSKFFTRFEAFPFATVLHANLSFGVSLR